MLKKIHRNRRGQGSAAYSAADRTPQTTAVLLRRWPVYLGKTQ